MFDVVSRSMMAFFSYFESCGDGLEAVLNEQEVNARSSTLVKYKQAEPQSTVLLSDEPLQCFHCGSFAELSSLRVADLAEEGTVGKGPIQLRQFEDSDIEFFPVPSSEVVAFYGKNDPRFRRPTHAPTPPVSRSGSIDDGESKSEAATAPRWTSPRALATGSPSPEVASKWIAMGTPTSTRSKENKGASNVPFDEAPQLSRLKLRKQQLPPTIPRRPPFAPQPTPKCIFC